MDKLAVGTFYYETRTPVTNIIGLAELIKDPRVGELNPKQAEYLEDVLDSARTLLSIIDDLHMVLLLGEEGGPTLH